MIPLRAAAPTPGARTGTALWVNWYQATQESINNLHYFVLSATERFILKKYQILFITSAYSSLLTHIYYHV